MSAKVLGVIVGGCLAASMPAAAQTPRADGRAEADARYQIGMLERVLETAVEHAVTVTRDRLQTLAQMPTDLLVSDNAHARGFRLEGYGVFFDVTVPSFETSTVWTSLRTLDQNDLGLDSAMKELQHAVQGNTNAEQALRRLELQVNPAPLARPSVVNSAGGDVALPSGSTASTVDPPGRRTPASPDPILEDPNEAYRGEVLQALKEAMLDHSRGLAIRADEWLTIAARGNDDRPRLAPADGGSRTRVLRVKGSDLLAYLARTIDQEEALKRIEVRVF